MGDTPRVAVLPGFAAPDLTFAGDLSARADCVERVRIRTTPLTMVRAGLSANRRPLSTGTLGEHNVRLVEILRVRRGVITSSVRVGAARGNPGGNTGD